MKSLRITVFAIAALFAAGIASAARDAAAANTTEKFHGAKANTGTAMFHKENGQGMLRVSDDFQVPDTPAPTWRVVDSKGAVYTLDAFKVKALTGNKEKREVMVPKYIHDIAKVQVYCAWAEVLLGEAAFPSPVK